VCRDSRTLLALGAGQQAAAELDEFRDEGSGFFPEVSGGIDFRGEQNRGGDIGAAREAVVLGAAGKLTEFSLASTDRAT